MHAVSGTRCNDSRPQQQPSPTTPGIELSDSHAAVDVEVYVDYSKGHDANPGTLDSPVKTALHGLELLRRTTAPPGRSNVKVMVLRAGVHYLNQTLALTSLDSGITIRGHPPDAPETPWLRYAVFQMRF